MTQGTIQELKQVHNCCFEVRLKADMASFAHRLSALGCVTKMREDVLVVQVPDGRSPQMLWEAAAEQRQQDAAEELGEAKK